MRWLDSGLRFESFQFGDVALLIFQCLGFFCFVLFFASGDFLGWTGATVINLQCTGNFSKSPYLFFMALLREEGIAAGRETVNKVCREGKLCPCQHWILVSLSLLPLRGLRKGNVEFSEGKPSKLERQHEFSWTAKLSFKWLCTISLLRLCSEDGSWCLQIGETEIAEMTSEMHSRCLVSL